MFYFVRDILHNGDSEKKKKIEFQFIKNPNSDFFGILKLIGAYYCSKNKNFISQEFYRNKKQLEEVIKLMKQLERIILNCYNNINLNLVSILSKIPTNKQQILLSQIILSGFIDHVARLWPKNKQISYNLFSVGSYQCLSCLDPVFIHPKSYFFSIEQPPWLVYQQLKKNKKTYMKGCTRIEPHWLFNLAKELCTISTPLDNPSPKYELYSDRIICFVEVKFSASGWSLPIQKIELIDNVLNLRYFAKFFIEGRVFFDFKQFSPYLILDSDLLINHNTQQKEVIDLLDELKQKNCNSKKRLKKIWINDRKFLLKIILMWIHPSKHKRLKYMWPLNS